MILVLILALIVPSIFCEAVASTLQKEAPLHPRNSWRSHADSVDGALSHFTGTVGREASLFYRRPIWGRRLRPHELSSPGSLYLLPRSISPGSGFNVYIQSRRSAISWDIHVFGEDGTPVAAAVHPHVSPLEIRCWVQPSPLPSTRLLIARVISGRDTLFAPISVNWR
jgi:hypothetical protein